MLRVALLTASEILNIFIAVHILSGEYYIDVCLSTSWRQSSIIEYEFKSPKSASLSLPHLSLFCHYSYIYRLEKLFP